MKLYLQERRKRQIRERMQEGYREMAGLNLSLAKEAFEAEMRPAVLLRNSWLESEKRDIKRAIFFMLI